MEDNNTFILLIQYHGRLFPQSISSHDIDRVFPGNSDYSIRRVKHMKTCIKVITNPFGPFY